MSVLTNMVAPAAGSRWYYESIKAFCKEHYTVELP